jgi:hypothetical protein
MRWWCYSSGFWLHVDSYVDANVSDKYDLIFRLEDETVCLFDMLAATYESTRCQNPEEQEHHNPYRREKLNSHKMER